MSAEEAVTNPPAEEPAPAPASATEPKPDEASDPAVEEKEESPSKAASSPVKKVARPAKPRSSMPAGGSKKGAAAGNGEAKSFKPGDIVLGRLKGYPPWPARVTAVEDLPAKVASQRPGKGPHIHCVQYFPAGDYSWLNSKEINQLSAKDIAAYLSEGHRKATGGLKEAYETAQDPSEWLEAQARFKAEREAEEAQVDELEDEDEGGNTGAKRKRSAADKKGAKKAKKEKKNGVSAADVESEEDVPVPKSKSKAAKPKADKAKPDSKAVENQAPVDDDPLASNPECVKVKDWRHKLQRAFLGKSLPTADEMTNYDSLFKTIEEYKDITIEALQYSKIGKVMKKIATLDSIPKNAELKITERASKLMNDWTDFINEGSNGQANGETKAAPAAADANGTDGAKMDVDSKEE